MELTFQKIILPPAYSTVQIHNSFAESNHKALFHPRNLVSRKKAEL